MKIYADLRPVTIPVNPLTARGTGVARDAVAHAAPAAAIAAPAQ